MEARVDEALRTEMLARGEAIVDMFESLDYLHSYRVSVAVFTVNVYVVVWKVPRATFRKVLPTSFARRVSYTFQLHLIVHPA